MYGRTDVRTYGRTDGRSRDYYVTTKISRIGYHISRIGYHISLAMELRWRALPAGSAMISDQNCTTRSSITTLLHPF